MCCVVPHKRSVQYPHIAAAVAPLSLALGKEFPYVAAMITSRLTSKAQTTIPQSVRAALRLREGDEIAYVIENGRVVLTKAHSETASDDPFQTFSEWNSPNDTKAYAGL
jgi:antitoxin PrlF